MADTTHRRGFFLFRPKFLLFCLYVAAYVMLRMHDEIILRQIAVPGRTVRGDVFEMAMPHPGLPRWRQQLWRALFSAAMVVEEEGQPVIVRVRAYMGRPQEREGEESLVDRAIEAGRSLLPNNAAQQQQQQQQYQQQQQPMEGLNPGERMIFDPRTQQ